MMKNFYLLFLFSIIVLFSTNVQGQIFVKHDASGANDGTSWADAFTDLSDALNASSPDDEIWVAGGTYKPGGTSPSIDAYFSFPHDLKLYGGFAGTETMLSERDWVTNETILSGDHNGDDIDDDFETNKTDNSLHVMWLTDTVTIASTVDGFTIRNGITEPVSGSGNARRGGGILSYGAPAVRNCRFTQNYGYFGGGLYPRGSGASGVIIEDCVFENNSSGFGGGIYLLSGIATINNCEFTGNLADDGSTGGRGGAIYNSGTSSDITDCTFSSNMAPNSSGGALKVRNGNDDPIGPVNVLNCTFDQNSASFGGAFGAYDSQTVVNLVDCEFTENSAATSGGATTNGFGATSNFTNCNFSENEANNGGAMYSQNDSATVNITNCTLSLNSANRGGAINISGDNEPGSTTPIPILTIENSYIQFNFSAEQGAGVNLGNANAVFKNTLFDNNLNIDEQNGIGGALSINTSDTIHATVDLINCTVVNNVAGIGAGIAHWKPGTESTSVLTIQNTIFYNPFGANYEIEDGDPTLVSAGGNLSTDDSMINELIATNDLSSTDPLFVDFEDGDFHLADGSPCIDAGIAEGAPPTDIEGLDRVGEVDMGAYENQNGLTSVRSLSKSFGQLEVFPNPVVQDDLNFTFESPYHGHLDVKIADIKGAVLMSFVLDKNTQNLSRSYNVSSLPKGIYQLIISNGQEMNSKGFVK